MKKYTAPEAKVVMLDTEDALLFANSVNNTVDTNSLNQFSKGNADFDDWDDEEY